MMVSRDRLGWLVAVAVTAGAVGLFAWRGNAAAPGAIDEMAVACDPAQQAVVSRHPSTAQVIVRCVPADAGIATMAAAPATGWPSAPAARTARAVPAGYTITDVPQVATMPQTAPRVVEPVRTSAPARRTTNGRSWQKRVAIIGGSAGAGAAIGALIGGKKGAAIGAAAGGGGATLYEVLRTRK